MRVIWAPAARDHVAAAFAWIASERPSAAVQWFESLVERVGSLSTFPDMGRMVPEAARPEVREVLVEPYRVVYRRDHDQVVVLGVFHERQQVDVEEAEA